MSWLLECADDGLTRVVDAGVFQSGAAPHHIDSQSGHDYPLMGGLHREPRRAGLQVRPSSLVPRRIRASSSVSVGMTYGASSLNVKGSD